MMRLLKNIEFIEQFVWTDQSIQIFKLVGDLGLLFLLFMVGLELDLLELNSKFKDSVVVAVFVLAITFSLSLAVSHFLARAFVIDSNYLLFVLYLGIACSSTALPVLARQLSELNLSHSRVGELGFASASTIGYLLITILMIILAFTKNSVMEAFYTILVLIGYILILIFLLRPLLVRSIQRTDTENGLSASIEYLVFWSLIVTACFFESLGVKAVFGGLLLGLVVPHQKGFAISLAGRLEDLVTVLFSPLFVVFSGFRIDLLIFRDGYIWFWMLMIFLVTVVGKLGGTMLACKFLLGLDIRESIATGLLVNSRGLLEIVVLNVGLDSGLISNQNYTLLMLQSMLSTLLTVPILKLVFPPTYQLAKGDLDLATEKESTPPHHSPQLNVLFCLRSIHCVASMITLCQSMYEADPGLTAVVLRLIGLDERISGVMMANDYAITIQRDAAIQLFRSYGLLNNIKMQTLLTVTGKENFADDIIEASNGMQTSWIVCPIEFSKGLYPKGWGEEMYQRLAENASCRVAVLLNRGFGVAAYDPDTVFSAISAQTRSISVIIQGANDDLAVCDIVSYMAQGSLYRISVHCIKPIDEVIELKNMIGKLNSFSNVLVHHYEFEPSIVSLAAKLHELCGHDLVIMGRELYCTESENGTIRHWLDVISKASVLVVKEALVNVSTFHP